MLQAIESTQAVFAAEKTAPLRQAEMETHSDSKIPAPSS